jgi:rod shape-determining protein MreD
MRWPVFAIFAFVALVLEVSVRNALRLDSMMGISPSFVACVAVLITLFANRLSALWACWILGVLMDLLPRDDDGVTIVGPAALGFVFAGYVVSLLRTMVFRRKALTLGAMTFIFLLAAGIVVVFITMIRSLYPGAPVTSLGAVQLMVHHALNALYGGVVAIPLGWLLLVTLPLWGFPSMPPRRSGWL